MTSFAVVFTIARTRSGKVARALLETKPGQVVISDRFPGYEWISDGRQLCWSHTIRTQSTIRAIPRRLLGSLTLPITRPRRPLLAGA